MENQISRENWPQLFREIRRRWYDVPEEKIHEAHDLRDLAGQIAAYTGKTPTMIQEELIHLFRTVAQEHPFLRHHFQQDRKQFH